MPGPYYRDVLFSLALFFLLLISANILLFPDIPGFIGIHPHPYLLAIVLMAGRFGRLEGYLAAVVAALVFSAFYIKEYYPFVRWELFAGSDYTTPMLSFLLAAVFIGEMRHIARRREKELLEENQTLKKENHRYREQLEIVIQIKEELENRLLGQQETLHSLYQATRALETLEEADFYQALTRLTARFTGATKVSLYVIDYPNDVILCVARFGWETEKIEPDKMPLAEGIFSLVIKHNQILSIKEIADRPDYLKLWQASRHKAYVYLPISMGSVTVAILTIDDIPFLKLNISTLRILSLIAELAVPALKNIIRFQDLQNMVQMDPVTALPKWEAFLEAAGVEFKKAARYHLDFSIVYFRLTGLEKIEKKWGHETTVEILKWFAHKLRSFLRSIDLCGVGEKNGEFCLALPLTSSEGMVEVIERVVRWFEQETAGKPWQQELQLRYGGIAYHPSMKSLKHMIRLAKHSMRINEISGAKQLV